MECDYDDRLQPPQVSREVNKALGGIIANLPAGYHIEMGGNIEDSTKANAALIPLFPVMIVLTLLVIIFQTRSLSMMTMVFMTAPLGLIGTGVLGKDVGYKQVSFETWLQIMASGGQKPPVEHNARAMYGEFAKKPEGRTRDSFLIQHLREAVIDLQNGILAGTNDVVTKIGGRQPTTLDAFITKHRKAFA